jgi:hypothetical protein
VHLSDLAAGIIEALPRFARGQNGGEGKSDGPDFAFTTTGERAVSGISKAKERLDKRMLELLRAALTTPARMPGRSRWGSGRCLIYGARQRPE